MKRIAYLIHWNEGRDSGVCKKVADQITMWVQEGYEVALCLFTRQVLEVEWRMLLPSEVTLLVQHYSSGYKRMKCFQELLMRIEHWSPDLIYHRFDLFYLSLPALLRKYPSVIEINTNDLQELSLGGKLRYYYHRFTRAWVLRAADGFVFVSKELSEEQHYRKYCREAIVIGNAVTFANSELAEQYLPEHCAASLEHCASAEQARFVFIGSDGQPWQGVDELLALAERVPHWRFDVIGIARPASPGELPELPDNVTFHGRLPRERYQQLLQQADIALGTLALYRKRMEEASPLKVREYLANGLPVIITYKDTDFQASSPYVLRLPNVPQSLISHLSLIEQFVDRWRGNRVPREQVQHLDVSVKEGIRLKFMDQVWRKRWA